MFTLLRNLTYLWQIMTVRKIVYSQNPYKSVHWSLMIRNLYYFWTINLCMIQNLVKYFVHNCKHWLTSPPFSCIRHSRQTRGKGRYICWHVPAESHGWTGGGRRDGDSVIVMRNIFLGRSFTNFTDTSKYYCHEMENTRNVNIVKRNFEQH